MLWIVSATSNVKEGDDDASSSSGSELDKNFIEFTPSSSDVDEDDKEDAETDEGDDEKMVDEHNDDDEDGFHIDREPTIDHNDFLKMNDDVDDDTDKNGDSEGDGDGDDEDGRIDYKAFLNESERSRKRSPSQSGASSLSSSQRSKQAKTGTLCVLQLRFLGISSCSFRRDLPHRPRAHNWPRRVLENGRVSCQALRIVCRLKLCIQQATADCEGKGEGEGEESRIDYSSFFQRTGEILEMVAFGEVASSTQRAKQARETLKLCIPTASTVIFLSSALRS